MQYPFQRSFNFEEEEMEMEKKNGTGKVEHEKKCASESTLPSKLCSLYPGLDTIKHWKGSIE